MARNLSPRYNFKLAITSTLYTLIRVDTPLNRRTFCFPSAPPRLNRIFVFPAAADLGDTGSPELQKKRLRNAKETLCLQSKVFFFPRRLQQISRIPAVQVKET